MDKANRVSSPFWLALVIGNTRLHWGYFYQEKLLSSWHTPHLADASIERLYRASFVVSEWQSLDLGAPDLVTPELKTADWTTAELPSAQTNQKTSAFPQKPLSVSDIWIASVVPDQHERWTWAAKNKFASASPNEEPHTVMRSHIPLSNIYPTLGIDRAINLLGAGQLVGWPTVVIDAGTAVTLTAGIEQSPSGGAIYGGAILPGLRLQREALAQKTGALSQFVSDWKTPKADTATLPQRWALDSAGAIASGLIYGITATIIDYLNDWWRQFPAAKAIFTGGDAPYLYECIKQRTPEVGSRVLLDSDLMFYGMSAYRKECLKPSSLKRAYLPE
ncbi:MAG: type III pantothenate kinase [Cyanobacteria bacterium J06621_11]